MSIPNHNYPRKNQPYDYHEKKLENPFFKRKERIIPLTGLKTKLIILLSFLAVLFLIWFIFISSFFRIKQITVSGLDQMSNEDIRNIISSQMHSRNNIIFPQGSLLFFNELKFKDTLKGKYRFQKTVITKTWPDKIDIQIIEKPLACVWNEGDKYYYADTDGYVMSEISLLDITDSKFPLISNQSDLKISDSRIQADPSYITFTANLYTRFLKISTGISIDRFIIDKDIDTVKLKTRDGLVISFNTKGDVDKQVDNLLVLKTQKLKDEFSKQKSIDLRYGDKIYYQ